MATKHNSVALERAADDEPIFVLRAQDVLAPGVIRHWAREAERAGCAPAKVREAEAIAAAMERWPNRRSPD